MNPITIEDQDNQFLIRIDKDMLEKETLVELLHRINIEDLTKRADFSEDIEQFGEEIKADWWSKNKSRWIKEE